MRPYANYHVPGTPDAAAKARAWVRGCVAAFYGGHPTLAGTAELLVSEAVTNALQHSISGHKGGAISLRFLPLAWGVHIEVHDCGSIAGARPHLRPADPSAEHGRGLAIIAALSDEWGVLNRPTSGVWFTISVLPA